MPKEIFDAEKFVELSENATECRMKVLGDNEVKFKLRTNKYLYTLKVDKKKAEELRGKIKCSITEL
ncbi:MAG: hypothetical protein KIH08_08815 [Candidatus Freyarchaeota archaeon]|nr:hypothetical protein [Candidatus Jordarchaeia archaeon]MBS7267329.1 hypothetical protein [Candidatus Jordarchaeia archaeon]MBS7279918.1 hypothetical protein [Candidatus Jordarchaeia archaeon]